jgi:hypothetical protein
MAKLSPDLVQEVLDVADSYTAEMKDALGAAPPAEGHAGSPEAERLGAHRHPRSAHHVVQELTLVHDALAEPESRSMQQAAWELRFQTGGLITMAQERLDALRAEAQARIGR